MKVFISWSGTFSRTVAAALRDWIVEVFQSIDVWMSAHDISAGAPWNSELHQRLRDSDFGILCLTRDNQAAPWVTYETGCLVMSVQPGRVVPYCLDLTPESVAMPLGQLQGVRADREGTFKLLVSLNAAMEAPLPEARLQKIFDKWWPDLCRAIGSFVYFEEHGNVLVARLDLDTWDDQIPSDVIRERLSGAIRGRAPRLVIDLSRATHMSSTGVGALLSTVRTARRASGEAALVVGKVLMEVFRLTKLETYFCCFATVEEAVEHIRRMDDEKG